MEKATLGSPVSPIVANLYMEYFKQKAVGTANHLPRLWIRCVDAIIVIQKEEHKKNFLEHINNVDPAIKFTVSMYHVSTRSMVPFPSWTPLSKQRLITLCPSQCIESPPHGSIHAVGQPPPFISKV